jgi:Adenylate and Guanylate cyclase catalytic domain
MKTFAHWSIRYKLLSLLLLMGVMTFAVTGTIAYIKYLSTLKQDVMNQLRGLNRSKGFQIESYYTTTGVPGQIQVTRAVYERLKHNYEFESRGMVHVKGKGEIEAWLLHGVLHPDEVVP